MICARTSAFLQENLLGLPQLPTEEEHVKAQAHKRAEAQRRIAEERRLAGEKERRRREKEELAKEAERAKEAAAVTVGQTATAKYRPGSAGEDGGVEVRRGAGGSGGGWKPSVTSRTKDADPDPMVQQMNIIRGYITEARGAGRWDEVTMLEENLRELQAEFWKQPKVGN